VRIRSLLTFGVLVVAGLAGLPLQTEAAAAVRPMSPEQCLSRSASAITDLNGVLEGEQGSSSVQVDRTWDLRDFSSTSSPNPTRYPFRLDAVKRVCVIGGSVLGNIPLGYSREQFYDADTGGVEWDDEGFRVAQTADSPWSYQYGSYAQNVSDAFDPNGLANGVNHSYLDRVHAKDIRDDCVEVEGSGYSPHTVTITRSLFDGCHNFLSMRPSGTSHADAGTSEGTLTIEDSLAYVKPNELGASNCSQDCTTIGGVPYMGNHVLFKWSSDAVRNVVVRNTVFRVDQPSAFSTRAMHWPAGVYENVTLVWTWPKPYTDYFDVPAGVKVTSDVKVWHDAKAAWLGNDDTTPPQPATNQAPRTDAGPAQTVTLPAAATLNGSVSDDGLPSDPGNITTRWAKVSGPGTVTFDNPSAVDTKATISSPGTYVLRLTATDGALTTSDDTTITASATSDDGYGDGDGDGVSDAEDLCPDFSAPGTQNGCPVWPPVTPDRALDRRVSAQANDAEENIRNGRQLLTSSDLEVGHDKGKRQMIGLRFTDVAIPQGAIITNAYVQFTTRAPGSGGTTATIWGQDADNANAFSSALKGISNKPRTTAAVSWSPGAWSSVGAAGAAQRTPQLATIVQEIVNRDGWTGASSIALLIEGLSGSRNGWAYDGSPSKAPLLHVEYALPH
jgi:hypothetical protein